MELSSLLLWGGLTALFYYLFIHQTRRDRLLSKFPAPPALPIIGHTLYFLFSPKEDLFPMLIRWCEKYGPVSRTFSFSQRFVMLADAKSVEKLVTSNENIQKGFDYDFMRDWLGDGLLISSGQKWFHRRKLLTPAFHFKILEDFMPIMDQESVKMVQILRNKYADKNAAFDFVPYITNCTMDIICETAMGKSIDAQSGKNKEYSRAVREFAEVLQERAFRPWLRNDFLWKRSSFYKKQQESLAILHGFTDSVIRERKEERRNDPSRKKTSEKADTSQEVYFGSKKKKAFLDLLLDVQEEVGATELPDRDLREETDTFMFAGHDTTSVAISFAMFALGAYPEIQAKVREEIDSIFGDDKDRPITSDDIAKMKYLDLVIKENLRVYPSVPFIQRHLTSDLKLGDDTIIPADVTVAIFIYRIHKDPEYFPEPHVFRPERFSETRENRHPYAYIPFSAGPRNCIGQKFALMEQKVILANLIRNFEIKSVKDPKDLVIVGELTLRSTDGIELKLTSRR